MVLDTSTVLAILLDEPERPLYTQAIEDADARWMSTATFVETSIVIDARYGTYGLQDLDVLIERAGIELVPVDAAQAASGPAGLGQFGKGRHPAALQLRGLLQLRTGGHDGAATPLQG